MSTTSGVVFKNLSVGTAFEIDSEMALYAVSWIIGTGATLTISSNESYIDNNSGTNVITASDTAVLSSGTGVISSRNQSSPLSGLTFTAGGATVVLMMYK